MTKRIVGIAIAMAFLLFFALTPPPEGLAVPAWHVFGVLFSSVIMWLFDIFPKMIVTLYVCAACVVVGCYDSMSEALKSFMTSASIMVLGSFFLAGMLSQTNIPLRLVGFLTRFTKDSGKAFLLVILATCTLISSFCDDMTAATIVYTFVVSLFGIERRVVVEENRALRAAMMIGIPLAAYAGGCITPVGAPSNVVAIELLRATAGVDITFLQWFLIMIPISWFIVIVLWAFLCLTLRPEPLDPATYRKIREATSLGPWTAAEKKSLAVFLGMVALWFAGSAVPILSSPMVVIIGAIVMYLPGVDLMVPERFQKIASWDLFFLLPGVMVMATVIERSSLIQWLIDNAFTALSGLPMPVTLFLACLVLFLIRVFIPAGPPVTILAIPALIGIGAVAGIHPVTMTCIGVVWGTICFMLPIDILRAYTYDAGQFTVRQMWRAEVPTVLISLAFTTFYMPLAVGLAFPG
ncbi:SLC13 family permease [Adlercreutzia faecimuris]|uniref:Anion permease n=1 Tax=Adlercreutzia faecimuris TaxID=2897341 RepID=A0ABS9WJ46_9ACTN|nr:SLC13 family permease [Adlercreutzia sp. JBNU-10]MCI2242893.1 anion permease [Adlercreutzia sp. JBNU-10]